MKKDKVQHDVFAGEYQALYVSINDEINKREGYIHLNGKFEAK